MHLYYCLLTIDYLLHSPRKTSIVRKKWCICRGVGCSISTVYSRLALSIGGRAKKWSGLAVLLVTRLNLAPVIISEPRRGDFLARYPDIQISRLCSNHCSDIQISRYPTCSTTQISRYPGPLVPDIQISRYPDIRAGGRAHRHITCDWYVIISQLISFCV